MKTLKVGDYVLATKYSDGDSKDHFCIGFFSGMLPKTSGDRFEVVDGDGKLFRANGFRRCEKISREVGDILVAGLSLIEQGDASVWYWRYHSKELKKIMDIR